MISELATAVTTIYRKYLRLHVVVGVVLTLSVIFAPKTALLSGLVGPLLTILVEALIGFFVGAIYYMSDAQELADTGTWLQRGETISDHPEEVENLRGGPALHEVFGFMAFFVLFLMVFLVGSASYALVWHEVGLSNALSEYAFHLGRAGIVGSPAFVVGMFYARLLCGKSIASAVDGIVGRAPKDSH